MFKKVEFYKSFYNTKHLQVSNLPEVVVCGRSNVGKSSFINSFFMRKKLAKISSTPGKTRSINYYIVDEKFYFVDLPGYGYAKASKKDQEEWANLINSYFQVTNNIKMILHLIDSRHAPTELDIAFNENLQQAQMPYCVILTKTDKLNQSEKSKSLKNIVKIFPELEPYDNLVLYSSKTRFGANDVLKIIKNAIFS